MTDDLPPLPEPAYEAYYYTADQLRAYGAACAAEQRELDARICDRFAARDMHPAECAGAIRAGS